MNWLATAVTLFTLASIGQCFGPHHPKGPHAHRKPVPPSKDEPNPTFDKELFQDEVHIKEDFDDIHLDTSQMNAKERASYYFIAHDADNNSKLDGLELIQALKHTMHQESDNDNLNDFSLTEQYLQYYSQLVDQLLNDGDIDHDGYLSYTEYLGAQDHTKDKTKA